MNVRNEIKAQIIRAGMTMQEVVDLLSDEYGLTMGKGADILPWSAEVTAVTAYPPPEEPSESPRHFAASMDESVIVGYYTLKKCLFVAPRCLQIPKKGQKIYGKK